MHEHKESTADIIRLLDYFKVQHFISNKNDSAVNRNVPNLNTPTP